MTDIRDLLPDVRQYQIIDVRSPGEFHTGHIPGAINIPLFADEERARVGTLYTQQSPQAALDEGLRIAGSKLADYLDDLTTRIVPGKETIIHCWRGGKRSEAMQWLFNFSGHPMSRLKGGYKAYRQSFLEYFASTPLQLNILGGSTGSGKTEILYALSNLGQQVIDLEKIARHKGSAFGTIGEGTQLPNEQFENNLYEAFLKCDETKPIWLENESRSIGRNHIPETLWWKMRGSVLYSIDVNRDVRLDRVIQYYSHDTDVEILKEAFIKIKKRLGGLDFQKAMKALDEHDLRTAADIALKYYDKTYTFQIESWNKGQVKHLGACDDILMAAQKLAGHYCI